MLELRLNGPEDLPAAVGKISEYAGDMRLFLLQGEMGAGKTTFVKAFCRSLGIEDTVSSPTFSIINEYLSEGGQSVYHFDFYRIKHSEEARETACEEYFDSGNFCFAEWPEKAEELFFPPFLVIKFEITGPSERLLKISRYE